MELPNQRILPVLLFQREQRMPRKVQRRKQQVAKTAAAEKPTQKKALAEALRHLGFDASHAALARFVKERFGMKLTFCIFFPKADTINKPQGPSTPLQQEPLPQAKCA
jgi:hypothetical protein